MLVVIDKSNHEEHLSQTVQTKKKQFINAVTFLTGYKGIFDVKDKSNQFYSATSITDKDGFVLMNIPRGSYEMESLSGESKRVIFEV